MRFVDVPAGPTHREPPAPSSSPVAFHSEFSLVPDDAPAQRLPPSRQAAPADTPMPVQRAPARPIEPTGLGHAWRKAWSSARWTLSTWLHGRARATRMAGRRVVEAAKQADPEPVYVRYASR